MVLQLEYAPRVETLRSYPAGTLHRLSQLLAMGAIAMPDPRREGFYEVESDSEVFYVHIAPDHAANNGRVLLIGIWHKPVSPNLHLRATRAA